MQVSKVMSDANFGKLCIMNGYSCKVKVKRFGNVEMGFITMARELVSSDKMLMVDVCCKWSKFECFED